MVEKEKTHIFSQIYYFKKLKLKNYNKKLLIQLNFLDNDSLQLGL